MTKQAKHRYTCLECGIPLLCPKCKNSRLMGSAFSLWLRKLASPLDSNQFYNTDIDHVWFNYKKGWFITIEEKQHGAPVTRTQSELLQIVSDRLARNGGKLYQETLRGKREIQYKGHYTIIFEKNGPQDSEWIEINGENFEIQALLDLLASGEIMRQKGPWKDPDEF